ncbi:MAG: hypothetical protein P8N02_14885, partial [Actinomycetota bacterium]|nr:hypothetical protein [Actinomycetota bacterium]
GLHCIQVRVARLGWRVNPWARPGQGGDEFGDIEVATIGQEHLFFDAQIEATIKKETEVSEVQPCAVGQDVRQVGIQVGGVLTTKEFGDADCVINDPVDCVLVDRQPILQNVRDVFDEQSNGELRLFTRSDKPSDPVVTIPIRDVVLERWPIEDPCLPCDGHQTMVIEDREAFDSPLEDPPGGPQVCVQLRLGPEASGPNAVVVVGRQVEQVASRARVLKLDIGDRHRLGPSQPWNLLRTARMSGKRSIR